MSIEKSPIDTVTVTYNYIKMGFRVYGGELQMRDDAALWTDADEMYWDDVVEVLIEVE